MNVNLDNQIQHSVISGTDPSVNTNNPSNTVLEQLQSAPTSTELLARGGTSLVNELSSFSSIDSARRAQLEDTATALIERHAEVRTEYPSPVVPDPFGVIDQTPEDILILDYRDMRDILRDISASNSFTDVEKAYIWSDIAERKGQPTLTGFGGGDYEVSTDFANPAIIDSHLGRAGNSPNHTHVSFRDGYHGFGGDGMARGTREEAQNRIAEHESLGTPIIQNPGDAWASMATVNAFLAFREAPEGQRFDAFADSWIQSMVR